MKKNASRSGALAALIVLIGFCAAQWATGAQTGPPLDVSSRLIVGGHQLGMAQNNSRDETPMTGELEFVDGRCVTACSSESLADGSEQLNAGFISRGNLLRRLGRPDGTTQVAGSTVWIYNVPLETALGNEHESTQEAFLYVLFEEYGDLFHLNRFEMTLKGSGRERWPSI